MAIERTLGEESASGIPVYRINGFDKADEVDIKAVDLLEKKLHELGLLDKKFVYMAFSPMDLDSVLIDGTDRDDALLYLDMDLLKAMEEKREGDKAAMLIVYNGNCLSDYPVDEELSEDDFGNLVDIPVYAFKDPANKRAAVAAIVIAEDFGVIN